MEEKATEMRQMHMEKPGILEAYRTHSDLEITQPVEKHSYKGVKPHKVPIAALIWLRGTFSSVLFCDN